MRASMGSVGSCYDNAAAESFFGTLKAEIGTRVWATREQARREVFAFRTYYIRNRPHSTLKYRTPHEARVCYRQSIALVACNPGVRSWGGTSVFD
jgi:transposase InsO family protein